MDLSRTVEPDVKRLDVAVLMMALAFAIILWFPDPLYLAILAGQAVILLVKEADGLRQWPSLKHIT